MQDQGERVVIDPRHALVADGFAAAAIAVVGSRPLLTPLRAALLVVGTIVGGVALSIILGTAPAHAADGDGVPAPDGGLLTSATNLASTATAATTTPATAAAAGSAATTGGAASTLNDALTATVTAAIPSAQTLVPTTGDTVSLMAPSASSIVQPVVAAVTGALTATMQSLSPLHGGLLLHGVLGHVAAADVSAGVVARATQAVAIVTGAASGIAVSLPNPAPGGEADGTLPSPVLTSSVGGPADALAAMLYLLAPALLAVRRRLNDDALPPSPVFETDTSPA